MSYIDIDGLLLCINAAENYITASNDQLEVYYITEYRRFTQIASAKIINNLLILEVLNGEKSFDLTFMSKITFECKNAIANTNNDACIARLEEKARIDNTFMRMRIEHYMYQVKTENKMRELQTTVEELRRVIQLITI